jgi:hypothetical protein
MERRRDRDSRVVVNVAEYVGETREDAKASLEWILEFVFSNEDSNTIYLTNNNKKVFGTILADHFGLFSVRLRRGGPQHLVRVWCDDRRGDGAVGLLWSFFGVNGERQGRSRVPTR